MHKLQLRRQMKEIYFKRKFCNVVSELSKYPEPARSAMLVAQHGSFEFQKQNTPADCFRADRPSIDKRRSRRRYRKTHRFPSAASCVVDMKMGEQGKEVDLVVGLIRDVLLQDDNE